MWTALHVLWSVAAKRLIRLGRLDGFDGDISYAVPPMTADRTGQYVSYPGIIGCYLRGINVLKSRINPALSNCKCLFTGGIHEKGSGEIVSSVCYTIYVYTLSFYPSAQKKLRRHLPNSLHEFPCKQTFTVRKSSGNT